MRFPPGRHHIADPATPRPRTARSPERLTLAATLALTVSVLGTLAAASPAHAEKPTLPPDREVTPAPVAAAGPQRPQPATAGPDTPDAPADPADEPAAEPHREGGPPDREGGPEAAPAPQGASAPDGAADRDASGPRGTDAAADPDSTGPQGPPEAGPGPPAEAAGEPGREGEEAGGEPGTGTAPEERAAPSKFRFTGGGYGHGVGMSQYGALGMALRGRSTADMIAFYYGGARPVAAGLPRLIRVGMLEARLDGVVVHASQAPGSHPRAGLWFRTRDRAGRPVSRGLPRGVTYTLRPEAGGVSVYQGSRRRFGPSARGFAVQVDHQYGVREPSLLTLPQAGRTLRWGYLEVGAVHDGTRPRVRAVASMTWQQYLRGVAEVPATWPLEVQRAQAIASRSYALAVVRAAGQHRGVGNWYGCDCGVRPDTRDQHYLGWANEHGAHAARWTRAVDSTDALVIRHGSTLVKAFYFSSSGGHTAPISTVFGGPDLPWYPARPDPDDAAGGRNPNFRWVEEHGSGAVTRALASLGVGRVTGIRAVSVDRSGRIHQAVVTGTRGSRRVPGTHLRRALRLKSTKFQVTPLGD